MPQMKDPKGGNTRDKTGQPRPAKLDFAFRAYRCKSSFHQIDDDVTCNLSASCNHNHLSTGPSSFQTSAQIEKRPPRNHNNSRCLRIHLALHLARPILLTHSSRSPGTLGQERHQQQRPNESRLAVFPPQGPKVKGTRHQISPIDDS